MIFITGDIYGEYDIHKFSANRFTMQNQLTRSDCVIICGDFGLVWDHSAEERYWLEWLDDKPWTTLWIDGNHENFDMLKKYPIESWHGGKIQKITDNIFHLCRGNIFEVDGKRIFAFSGAESHDKRYRKLGVTMWKEEIPNQWEMTLGRKNLESANCDVDIIVTHSLPSSIQRKLFHGHNYSRNRFTDFFDEVDKKTNFKLWFSGHYHCSDVYYKNYIMNYNNIVNLTDTGFERVYPKEK